MNNQIIRFYEQHIQKVKPSTDGWFTGLCPFHYDKNPSFSFEATTGNWICHAGCGKGALQLFREKLGISNTYAGNSQGKIAATYDYTDENGQLIFQSVRYEPKDFKQRRPDGKEAWSWSLQGVCLVPYNLPEVIKADTVIVCEGEKDCETLKALGLVASTNPMGAGKWCLEYNHYFKDKHVIILPDNDEAGLKHADKVAESLKDIVASIKIVQLPGLPDKGDVSDWIGQGHSKDELLKIITEANPIPHGPDIQTDSWPDPIPLTAYDALPEFPIRLLPEEGRRMVESIAEVAQVDPGMVAGCYLGSMAIALQKKLWIDLKTHTEPISLFVVIVADPGERKSFVISEMAKPLYSFQREQAELQAAVISKSIADDRKRQKRLEHLERQYAKAVNDAGMEGINSDICSLTEEIRLNPPLTPPVYIADDVTPEKLAELMHTNNECMGIISAEGGIFSIMAGRYSDKNINIDIFLKGHAGDEVSVYRIGRSAISMRNPALSLCLCCQPEVVKEAGSNRQFLGRGLIARFLYVQCRPMAGYRKRNGHNLSESIRLSYGNHMRRLLDLPRPDQPTLLELSPEAQKYWDEFHDDVETDMQPGGSLSGLKAWGSKLAGAAARIAGLLHMAQYGGAGLHQQISLEKIKDACGIGVYLKQHALAAFDMMGEIPEIESAKIILDFILQHHRESFKSREVMQNKNAFKKMDQVEAGLKILTERGFIRPVAKEYNKKTGRPEAPTYEVNPKTKI